MYNVTMQTAYVGSSVTILILHGFPYPKNINPTLHGRSFIRVGIPNGSIFIFHVWWFIFFTCKYFMFQIILGMFCFTIHIYEIFYVSKHRVSALIHLVKCVTIFYTPPLFFLLGTFSVIFYFKYFEQVCRFSLLVLGPVSSIFEISQI